MIESYTTYPGSRHESLSGLTLSGIPVVAVDASTTVVAEIKEVHDVVATTGDHKSPTPHRYKVRRTFVPWGNRTEKSRHFVGPAYSNYSISGFGVYPYSEPPLLADAPFTFQEVRDKAISRLLESLSSGNTDVGSSSAEAGAFEPSPSRGKSSGRNGNDRAYDRVSRGLQKYRPPITAMSQVVGSFKRGSKAWFLWNYCLKPTMNDLYNAVNFEFKSRPFVVKGSCTKTFNKSTVQDSSLFEGMYCELKQFTKMGSRFKALVSVGDPELYNLHRMTTFNPALMAWNAMPLSFVVDWFVDVGRYMEEFEASLGLGLSIHWVEERKLVVTEEHYEYRGITERLRDGFYTTQSQSVDHAEHKVSFERIVSYSLPRPSLRSYFSPHLSPSRNATAGFLLGNYFSGKWKP